jgi:hypothetical protein
MAEGKLTFLTEVELPPFCFLSEAVEWVAFGRVPQMQHHSDGSTDEAVDYRFYWREMPDNFQPSVEHPWFDRLEFDSLGLPINEAYFEAAEKCYIESVTELPKRIVEYQSKDALIIETEGGTTIDFYEQQITEARAKLAELGPLQEMVDEVEAQFEPHYEVACAKLFQLLALGQITCQSLDMERWERLVDEGEYQEAARFEDVPQLAFSLAMGWANNELKINGSRHACLRVRTLDILEKRSNLFQPGRSLSVERFGAFYTSSNAVRTNKRVKVGRRSVVDWKLLETQLQAMTQSGSLPEGKENCIYELIVFAESTLGKAPSRTAVQRNLGRQLDAIYARN